MSLILTPVEVAQHLVDAGFTGWEVVTMGAIAVPETTNRAGEIDAHAVHVVDRDPEAAAYRSVDWGAWQINDYWQRFLIPRVLDDLGIDPTLPWSQSLLDPAICAKVARAVFLDAGGDTEPSKGYSRWATWENDMHLPFFCDALAAAREVGVDV